MGQCVPVPAVSHVRRYRLRPYDPRTGALRRGGAPSHEVDGASTTTILSKRRAMGLSFLACLSASALVSLAWYKFTDRSRNPSIAR